MPSFFHSTYFLRVYYMLARQGMTKSPQECVGDRTGWSSMLAFYGQEMLMVIFEQFLSPGSSCFYKDNRTCCGNLWNLSNVLNFEPWTKVNPFIYFWKNIIFYLVFLKRIIKEVCKSKFYQTIKKVSETKFWWIKNKETQKMYNIIS